MESLLLQSDGLLPAGVLLTVILVTGWSSIERILPHEKRALTVRGEYRKLLEPGLTLIPPFVSETHAIDMRVQTIDVPRQEAITQDNLPVTADAVVYIQVMDAEKAFLEIDDHKRAVKDKSKLALRTTIGDHESSVALHNHSTISYRVRQKLNETTEEWGVRVETVEVRDVTPPSDWQAGS